MKYAIIWREIHLKVRVSERRVESGKSMRRMKPVVQCVVKIIKEAFDDSYMIQAKRCFIDSSSFRVL